METYILVQKHARQKAEVLRIAEELDVSSRVAFSYCVDFWEWADENFEPNVYTDPETGRAVSPPDGDILVTDVTAKSLDLALGIDGFWKAYCSAGWGVTTESGHAGIVNFHKWGGKSAKSRARNTLNKRASRKRHDSVTQMSSRNGDKSVTREEKRTEELKTPATPPRAVDPARNGNHPPIERAATDGIQRFDDVPSEVGKAIIRWRDRAKGTKDSHALPVGMQRQVVGWWAEVVVSFPEIDASGLASRIDEIPGEDWKRGFPSGLLMAKAEQTDRNYVEAPKNRAIAHLKKKMEDDQ